MASTAHLGTAQGGCLAAASPRPGIRELDEAVTRRQYGYASVDDYYAAASSDQRLPLIATPLLLLNAYDDPIAPRLAEEWFRALPVPGRVAPQPSWASAALPAPARDCSALPHDAPRIYLLVRARAQVPGASLCDAIAHARANEQVVMALTSHGGHLGWCERTDPWGGPAWTERVVAPAGCHRALATAVSQSTSGGSQGRVKARAGLMSFAWGPSTAEQELCGLSPTRCAAFWRRRSASSRRRRAIRSAASFLTRVSALWVAGSSACVF